MFTSKNRPKLDSVNLLELRPQTCSEWEYREENLISLKIPKFRSEFLKKWLLPRMRQSHYRINLDLYGSTVWKLCDGQHTVQQIGQTLQETFGEAIEPLYDRLGLYLKQLEHHGLIKYPNFER